MCVGGPWSPDLAEGGGGVCCILAVVSPLRPLLLRCFFVLGFLAVPPLPVLVGAFGLRIDALLSAVCAGGCSRLLAFRFRA